jgi:hypothetical protein
VRIRLPALALIALAGCRPVIQLPSEPLVYVLPSPDLPEASATPDAIPEKEKPLIVLPAAPGLTQAGHDLILEFETDGRSGYKARPEWPRGQSGVTVGIGYDCGYMSATVVRQDWHRLTPPDPDRLATTAGITGQKASAKLSSVRDVLVQWEFAIDVFDNIDVAREFASCRHAYTDFDELRANAQAALISLGFNRGYQMSGPARSEMRAIRDLVPKRDYDGMAAQLRKMVRVWKGTVNERGLTRRRLAEARLMETP